MDLNGFNPKKDENLECQQPKKKTLSKWRFKLGRTGRLTVGDI